MDDSSFAHQLATWIDPNVAKECARRYDTDRDVALSPAFLAVGSGCLTSGEEGNYADLVRKFLRGFRLTLDLVEVIRNFAVGPDCSEDSWRWLTKRTVDVNVHVCNRDTVPTGAPWNTILLLKERDAVVDLLRAPVFALLDLVDHAALTWRPLAEHGISVLYESNVPMQFYAYVDWVVGSS